MSHRLLIRALFAPENSRGQDTREWVSGYKMGVVLEIKMATDRTMFTPPSTLAIVTTTAEAMFYSAKRSSPGT